MTERGNTRLSNDVRHLSIGASSMRWTGQSLEVSIDETCAPIPRRIRGTVRLFPASICERSFDLDPLGDHRWRPIAPCSRIEVSLTHPRLEWRGSGYLDSNTGGQPLEKSFRRWYWSRSIGPDHCLLYYDVESRAQTQRSIALKVLANGDLEDLEAPPVAALPSTRWRVSRLTRADAGIAPRVLKTWEDGPFYSRSLLQSRAPGAERLAVHEALDLDRFSRRWVQCLLPFRMPRIS